jgi:hypothetical protein
VFELLLPELELRAAGGVVLLGAVVLLGVVVLFGVCAVLGVLLFGVVLLVGLEPLLGAVPFGVALGFKFPGVIPPGGVVGVPGASGGFTPGGDEFDGGAFAGDLLVDGAPELGDGDCEDGADDDEDEGAELEGAAGAVCAWAPAAAAKPSVAAATTVCNLFITETSFNWSHR